MSSFKFTGLAAGTVAGDSTRYEQVLLLAGGTMTGNLLFTDATYDIGASGATRPRDLFLSRNAVIGGTTTLTGAVVSNLIFTDATYDIGASGATRPRDLFLSRNAVIGGTLGVTGVTTFTTDIVGSATDWSIRSNTADATDNKSVALVGGGSASTSRGAYVQAGGNEHATIPGFLDLAAGASGTGKIRMFSNGLERASVTVNGSFVVGDSAASLATTATNGFLYVPNCAGTPTGTPTAIAGSSPIVVNIAQNKLYFYSGGAWQDAGP